MDRPWCGEWDGDNARGVFLRAVPLVFVEPNSRPRVVSSGSVLDGVVHSLGAVLEFVQGVTVRVTGGGCVVDRVRSDPFEGNVELGVCVGVLVVSEWYLGSDCGECRGVVGAECFDLNDTRVW